MPDFVSATQDHATRFDPDLQPHAEIDPAQPLVIGQLITKAMIGRERLPLTPLRDRPFSGSGVDTI